MTEEPPVLTPEQAAILNLLERVDHLQAQVDLLVRIIAGNQVPGRKDGPG